MRLTIVGSGDAFGSGGRFNTCFWIESNGRTILIDFGASSLVALKAHGLDPNRIDAIVLTHLHGDHFGGLPFLLLDAQLLAARARPLLIVGPPGARARLDASLEAFFPRAGSTAWRFRWEVAEIEPGSRHDVVGHAVDTVEVEHPSGAPSTAVRLSDGGRTLAYSGDTRWTDALVRIADGADLFLAECYEYSRDVPFHMNFNVLKSRRADLNARRVMLTHMNPSMLARLDEALAAGFLVASDGLTIDV